MNYYDKFPVQQLINNNNFILQPYYLVYGQEPQQLYESINFIKHLAHKLGYNDVIKKYITNSDDWEDFLTNNQNIGLFADKTYYEFHINCSIGKYQSELLAQHLHNSNKQCVTLIVANNLNKIDYRQAWISIIKQHGLIIKAATFSSQLFPEWIKLRLQQVNINLETSIINLISKCFVGNLVGAAQFIYKLSLLPQVDEQVVTELLSEQGKFKVFDLIDSAINGDSQQTFKIFHSLQATNIEPSLILWTIANELRVMIKFKQKQAEGKPTPQIAKELNIWQNKASIIENSYSLTIDFLQKLQQQAAVVDTIIKTSVKDLVWQPLLDLYLSLATVKFLCNKEYV